MLGSPENSGPENFPPVGVFWDIENCSVPSGRSAGAVVQRIRSRFFQGHREAEFICVCDISKESKAVIQELNNCQVPTVIYFILIVVPLQIMSAIHILNEKLSTRGGRYDGSLYTMQRFPSVDIWQYCFQSGTYPLVSLLYIRGR